MRRGGIALTLALLVLSGPVALAGESATPDLMFVSRGGQVLTGDDLYNDDGIGQQRSVIADQRVVLTIRLENDGGVGEVFAISGTSQSTGFHVRYLTGQPDVTGPDLPGNVETGQFTQRVDAGKASRFRVVIEADLGAPLGATQLVQITATDGTAFDTVRVTVTKTSTPPD